MATYLVTQATGQQGQQVVAHLLAAGAKAHALVRDVEKVPQVLKHPGVTLFEGESKNLDDVFQAAQGCQAAYLNTFPYPGLELLQAQTVVAACKKAGVERVVANTTIATNDKTVWDNSAGKDYGVHKYFTSKAAVEDAVRGANFEAYTILRPAVLIQDFLLPGVYQNFPGLPKNGELDHPFEDGAKTPYTDAFDVGKFVVAAFLDPTKFNGQEIDLSNEALTVEEVHEILVKVSGKDVGLRKRTPEEIEEYKTTVYGQRFSLMANQKDFGATAMKGREVESKYGISFTTVEAALQREKARLMECLPA